MIGAIEPPGPAAGFVAWNLVGDRGNEKRRDPLGPASLVKA